MKRISQYPRGLDKLQKISVSLMGVLVLLTFVGANLHAVLWQSSAWLVSTVLPAVVVDLTNEERADLNAPELRRNVTLDEAARLKAKHMAQNEYFSHFSPTGVSPWHWFQEAGYVYAHAGENLAIHFTDSSEVVEAWMDSPTHRANIANGNYTEIGVGTAKGEYEGYDTVYVVQLFGTPAVVPPAPTPAPVPEPAVEENLNAAELADITNSLNDIAVAVEALNADATQVVAVESDPPEVLAENTETLGSEVAEATPVAPPAEPVLVTEIADATLAPAPAPIAESPVTPEPADVVVVESTIATSSGLAVASISELPNNKAAGATIASFVTQPNELLQWIYMILGMLVMALLLFSAAFEARQLHFTQVAYSFVLLGSMGALWYVHNLLTQGAVIT